VTIQQKRLERREVRPYIGRLTKARQVFIGFVGFAIVFGGACSRRVEPPDSVAIGHEISPEPPRVGVTTVTLKLADRTSKPIAGARIVVEADMSHAGMSPRFADAKEAEAGRYQAQVEFQMAGDWVILLHITLPDGKKLERQFDVRGVRPN
jgi:hypothetical protein